MIKWQSAIVASLLAVPLTAVPAVASAASADGARDTVERRRFDLQAHRGGMGLVVENTLDAFANALRVGVSTLELDIQITEDGKAVVTHDRHQTGRACVDTGPAVPGDPEYPYVGKFVHTLSLAQIKTLDCGSKTQPDFPGQRPAPGARMPLLSEVFDLVKSFDADRVKLNVETKVEAGAPSQTAPREQFVQAVVKEVRRARILDQVTIQSFDWGALMRMRQVEPRLPLVALDNYHFLQIGQPGASPWLGGIDIDDFGGDPLKAIASFGATSFSPVHGYPEDGTADDPDYQPYVTRSMVERARRLGIKVIPWSVNDLATMNKLMDDGVHGLITDYPDRLRALMASRGFALPRQYDGPALG
ncbi:glycerophosphodiester phosphodiesterase family protein [Nonomuraea sp. NPDC050790]|uniref:glycerophosphodiester phosphodiesterase family protein n=1 Tax=Nonomuraea sp. NPDC050790 TaxID=3364371 RepID=UPI0037ABEED9